MSHLQPGSYLVVQCKKCEKVEMHIRSEDVKGFAEAILDADKVANQIRDYENAFRWQPNRWVYA
jgi:hypothetical protein